jgi:hypothetical protein
MASPGSVGQANPVSRAVRGAAAAADEKKGRTRGLGNKWLKGRAGDQKKRKWCSAHGTLRLRQRVTGQELCNFTQRSVQRARQTAVHA